MGRLERLRARGRWWQLVLFSLALATASVALVTGSNAGPRTSPSPPAGHRGVSPPRIGEARLALRLERARVTPASGTSSCDGPRSDFERAGPAMTALAESIAAKYAEPAYLGRPLGAPLNLYLDTEVIRHGTDAFACPEESIAGENGRIASCSVHLEPKFSSGSQAQQLATLAHEIFHCYQYSLGTYADAELLVNTSSLAWLTEGQAEWAGDVIAAQSYPGYADGWYDTYLEAPTLSFFQDSYSAVGFYDQLNQWAGYSIWQRLDVMLTAAEQATGSGAEAADVAAYNAALAPASPQDRQTVIDTWASSFDGDPTLGAAWSLGGPSTPPPTPAASLPPLFVDSGQTSHFKADPYANDLIEGTPNADVVVVDVQTGTARFEDPSDPIDLVLTGTQAICHLAGGCSCPGQPIFSGLIEPGGWLLGLNGATASGAKVDLSGETLADYCKSLPPVAPNPTVGCVAGCAQAGGDVHLATFDGLDYDFQAVGEFVLVKSTTDNLQIQERTTSLRSLFFPNLVSWPSAIAMQVGSHRVGFYILPGKNPFDGTVAVHLDGRVVTVPQGGERLSGGGSISESNGAYQDDYTVTWPDGSYAQVSKAVPWLDLIVALNTARIGHVVGLLGTWDGRTSDDFSLRDGRVLPSPPSFQQLYQQFANSWRITQDESLFDYARGQSTATFTDRSLPTGPEFAAPLPPTRQQIAQRACRNGFGNGLFVQPYLKDCLVDVALTEDTALAGRWLAAQDRYLTSTFPIEVGQTVTPGRPRRAGDIAVPSAEQRYTFHAEAGEAVVVTSDPSCSEAWHGRITVELNGPDGAPIGRNASSSGDTLCSALGPFTLTQSGTYTIVVNPIDALGIGARLTGTYTLSLMAAKAAASFPITVGTTVGPGAAGNAGDLAQPYSVQDFTFHAGAGEILQLTSNTPCEPGTAGSDDLWTVIAPPSSGAAGPGTQLAAAQLVCHSLGAFRASTSGTDEVVVNGSGTFGVSPSGTIIRGTQAATGTFSFTLRKASGSTSLPIGQPTG